MERDSEKSLGKLLFTGLCLITIAVYWQGVTDPVNVPKFFILGAVSVSGVALLNMRDWKRILISYKYPFMAVGVFLAASLSSLIFSPAPLSQSLYGAYGRNNGFLLYIFLIMLLVTMLAASRLLTFISVLNAMYYAGVVNVIYCLWVVAFGDFIGWSNPYGNILGTLGNPNFIGSFFGMFSAVVLSRIISHENSNKSKIVNLILLLSTYFLIYESHAVQGRILGFGALLINIFYLSRSKFKSKFPSWLIIVGSSSLGILGILGTLQKGPFSPFLYKDSVSLRGQYWYAGIQMAKEHLINGVGFDAYGDWYRTTRRASALIRPGVDTTSNAAHNVFIDIFAFGGIALLISYIGLVILILTSIVRQSKVRKSFDPIFVSLTGAWICYQVQSVISINQIGLAIWGWVLGGAILAYEKIDVEHWGKEVEIQKNSSKSSSSAQQIVSPNLRLAVAMILGMIVSVPPLSGDMKWRSAQLSRDANLVAASLEPTYMNPVSSFRYVNTVGVFIDSQLPDLALKYSLEATAFNPRSYESWRLFLFLNNATQIQRTAAIKRMKILDPLNPEIKDMN